jgi:hypothetical protein
VNPTAKCGGAGPNTARPILRLGLRTHRAGIHNSVGPPDVFALRCGLSADRFELARVVRAVNRIRTLLQRRENRINDTNNKPGDSAAYWHAFIALGNFSAHLVLPRQERIDHARRHHASKHSVLVLLRFPEVLKAEGALPKAAFLAPRQATKIKDRGIFVKRAALFLCDLSVVLC